MGHPSWVAELLSGDGRGVVTFCKGLMSLSGAYSKYQERVDQMILVVSSNLVFCDTKPKFSLQLIRLFSSPSWKGCDK